MTYAQLRALDAGSWFDASFAGATMPTLAEVAARCFEKGLAANIEIKPCEGRDVRTGRLVAEEAARLWADAALKPLVSSFSYAALEAAAEAAPGLPRGMLHERIPGDWRAQAAALACVSMHVDHRQLGERVIGEIKDAGLRILAYTVNDPQRARELAQWGVDAICTDRIDLIGADFAG
jgi:glycerophosphoryl diester phosphodiesterase